MNSETILTRAEALAAELGCSTHYTVIDTREKWLERVQRRILSGKGPFSDPAETEESLAKRLLAEMAFFVTEDRAIGYAQVLDLWQNGVVVTPGTYRVSCDDGGEHWWLIPYSNEPLRIGHEPAYSDECLVYLGLHGQVLCYVAMPDDAQKRRWPTADTLVLFGCSSRTPEEAGQEALNADWSHQNHAAVQALQRVLGHRMAGRDPDDYDKDRTPYVVFPFGEPLSIVYNIMEYMFTLRNANAPEEFDNDNFHIEVTITGQVRLYYNFNSNLHPAEFGRQVEARLRELFPKG